MLRTRDVLIAGAFGLVTLGLGVAGIEAASGLRARHAVHEIHEVHEHVRYGVHHPEVLRVRAAPGVEPLIDCAVAVEVRAAVLAELSASGAPVDAAAVAEAAADAAARSATCADPGMPIDLVEVD